MKTYKLKNGTKFKACNNNCALNFKTDRKNGLIYGSVWTKAPSQGGENMSWEQFSIKANKCAYCSK